MDTAKQAVEIVRDAERRLRSLVGEAATAGEYELAMRITEWARSLGELDASQSSDDGNAIAAGAGADEESSHVGSCPATEPRLHGEKRIERASLAQKRKEYPVFLRQGDVLIKVGWSKSQGSTYEHRAPKKVLDAVVRRAVVAAKRSKSPFTAESLTDVRAQDDDIEVPGYQLYLCLAWLKRCKLIRQHGRKGYSLVSSGTLVSSIDEKWASLPRQTL